jgi:hypothetical protein
LLVIRVGANAPVKPRNRLRIVIEHIRLSIEDCVKRRFIAIEIRNQNFDLALGI